MTPVGLSRLVRPAILPDGTHIIQTHDLSIGFNGRALCSGINLSVDPGEALFVVGDNGAGKSTLLRTCLGLHPVVAGRACVLGDPADPTSVAQRSGIARDLDEESFFPGLSLREHLMLVCIGHGIDDVDDVVDAVLDKLRLSAVADVVPDRLSSGQRRRLVLASVLARPRSLLVLDEPERRLDLAGRAELASHLTAERKAGGALLVASHDPSLMQACASAVLHLGQSPSLLNVEQGIRALEEGR